MIMKAHFTRAVEELKTMLFEETARAENAVHAAIAAAEKGSVEDARTVIENDKAIDSAEIKVEEECLKILALYQPVASDLRLVVTILKINNEIERVGDLAVNIAERVEDIARYSGREIDPIDFKDMVYLACKMLRDALDALAYHDIALATEVMRQDDAVDAFHRGNYGRVLDMILCHSDVAQYYMDGLTISRCLERIADIATNIAEDVIYLESGTIVRHRPEGEKNG